MTKPGLLYIFLFLSSWSVFAQTSGQTQSLRIILDSLSQRYGIEFNYADETIDEKYVKLPQDSLSLDAVLQNLEESTSLNFEKIAPRLISIAKKEMASIDICGLLLSGEDKQPVVGAVIQTNDQATISDDNGKFILNKVSPEDILRVQSLGFDKAVASAREFIENPCVEFMLHPKVIKLQEVVISNLIINGINISSDGAIRIDTRNLGILPGLSEPDVLHAIQALPGIQSINETVSDINVRGGTNDQNLIYWDGIKMYQSGHFFGLISAFNPYITDEVTLIKNGTTTELSDGVSSTIDIRTDNQINNTITGGAGINMLNADLYLKTPLAKNVSLHLSGRRSISDLIKTPTYNQYFNRAFRNTAVTSEANPTLDSLASEELFNFYDISAKLLINVSPKEKLRISFINIHNKISYQENAMISNNIESKTSELEQGSVGGAISYHRLWNERLSTRAEMYTSSYLLDAINFDVRNEQRLIQENKIVDMGLKLNARYTLNNTWDLLTGYQFNEVGVGNLEDINNPTFRRFIKRVLRNHAVFTEGNFSSTSGNTGLRIGLRANYFEKFNCLIVEPRLAFNQKFLTHFSLEVLGEMKSQTTSQVIDFQNDFLGVEKRRWVLANEEDIPIAESKQISVGLRFERNQFLLSAEAYVKQVDGISSSSQGFQNQFQYVRSSGSYIVKGADVLLRQQWQKVSSWLGYSIANNQYDFPAFIPPVFPANLDIRHTISLGTNLQLDNFQISAGINWRTGKPYTEALGIENNEIIYDEPNEKRLDNYLRVDLSSVYHWHFSPSVRGELGISVWNLIDRKNIVNTFYQIDETDNLKTVQQFALGFTPNMMFRVSF